MSNITSGFVPTVGSIDVLKDIEGFAYKVLIGSPTNLGAITPTNQANTVQIVNKGMCPLKATITIQPPSSDKGGALPPTETKEVVICSGEVFSATFDGDVVVDVTLEEAAAAPDNAITPDLGSAVVANATQELLAYVRFLNV